jgi:chemotaxis protein MotB
MNRKPSYLQPESAGKERWLISYTDIVTVLLILFVSIAAQSLHSGQAPPRAAHTQTAAKIAAAKPASYAAPVASPPASLQAPAPATPAPVPQQALKEANAKLREQGLDSRLEKRGLVITLPQEILFPSGEDRIAPSALPVLSQVAQVIESVPNKIALVGHADSVPIHNRRFRNNWELSAARSLSLLKLLSTRYGIPESRLSIQSYGAYDPKEPNDTAAGRAENRRVEILLLAESAQ